MSETPKTDEVIFDYGDGEECVSADFARAQERRIAALENVLRCCEMWLGTVPEGKKMQALIRATLTEPSNAPAT